MRSVVRSPVHLAAWSALLICSCGQLLGFDAATLDQLSVDSLSSDSGIGRDEETRDAETPEDRTSALPLDAGHVTDPELNCTTFCQTVQRACGGEGEFAVYDSELTCQSQCAAFALGTLADDVGNTVGCRYTHARVALAFPGERAVSCRAAGPGGDGICGANCQGYCSLMMATCDDFTSRDECLLACAELDDIGGFSLDDIQGNSVQCRLYHLGAAVISPTLHCRHAAGAYPCSPEAE